MNRPTRRILLICVLTDARGTFSVHGPSYDTSQHVKYVNSYCNTEDVTIVQVLQPGRPHVRRVRARGS